MRGDVIKHSRYSEEEEETVGQIIRGGFQRGLGI